MGRPLARGRAASYTAPAMVPLPIVLLVSVACLALAPARSQAGGPARGPGADTTSASPAAAPPETSAATPAVGAASLASAGYRLPTARERVEAWGFNAFGPSALAGDFASAGWGQWVSGEPEEWSKDGDGFSRRFGVAAATTGITETSFAVLSAAFREDARYYRCPCTGLVPRAAHALRMTFVARRADGRAAFSVPKTVSPFAGPLVTRAALYPDRYTLADGALSGVYALLMNAGWNLAREFVLEAPAW